jgi:hypothetical protein
MAQDSAVEEGPSFEDVPSAFEGEPTAAEIEEEDRRRLRHREAFRAAADHVAAAFARFDFVQKIVLFGSVAEAPRRETPHHRRYRRAGVQLWHESKDVDLAVWVSDLSRLRPLNKARSRAVNDLQREKDLCVAHHQVDVFLLEPGTDRLLGFLCTFGECPKPGKRECRTPGCGASRLLRVAVDFALDPDAVQKGTVLFDRAARGEIPNPG